MGFSAEISVNEQQLLTGSTMSDMEKRSIQKLEIEINFCVLIH